MGARENASEENMIRSNGNIGGKDSQCVLCTIADLGSPDVRWITLEVLVFGTWYAA